ncbi:hypothetical protein AHiyo1_11250 [Arthrobacter sp. Hiyo1]|nr:hypothetical protein AHiyo1_11250 [Arthrobacter sp. Hiyo1]
MAWLSGWSAAGVSWSLVGLVECLRKINAYSHLVLCFLSETVRAPATRLVLNLCDGGHFFQGLGLINSGNEQRGVS